MSKKHFVAMAQRLKFCKPSGENKYANAKAKHVAAGKLAQWEEMVKEMASFCASQSSAFDRGRFLTACGYDVPAAV